MSDQLMAHLLQSQGGSGGQGAPSLSDIDSDGDGAINKTEMEALDTSKSGSTDTSRADRMFAAMDTNGDGSVSATEKSAFDEQMAADGPHGGHHGGHHGGPEGLGGPPQGLPPGDMGMGDAVSTSSASSTLSSTDPVSDFASLLKDLQGAIESYSQTSLQSMASASPSSLSVAA